MGLRFGVCWMSPNQTLALCIHLQMTERCYLMKQVLNFTLEEVLLPQSDRSLPYMNEVVGFLKNLRNKLSLCVSFSACVHPLVMSMSSSSSLVLTAPPLAPAKYLPVLSNHLEP